MKRIYRTLALLLALALLSPAVSAADYERVRTYSGRFADVDPGAWYAQNVADAYEYGLIDGKSDDRFDPEGTLTIAEAVKLAVVCHQLLTKGIVDDRAFAAEPGDTHWADGYLRYGWQHGIVTDDYETVDIPISRGSVAVLFARAVNTSGIPFEEINEITFGELPDVDTSQWYATSCYRMYRWGILTGNERGEIKPETTIRRSEMAAILSRVINPAARIKVTPAAPDEPVSLVTDGVLTLWEGPAEAPEVTFESGFAADFTVSPAGVTPNASRSLQFVNDLAVEVDNISFRLCSGSGYEAFSSAREILNAAAVGVNGKAVRSTAEVYTQINEAAYVWADGERMTIAGLWYAEYGEYAIYALYFDEPVDLTAVKSYRILVGSLDGESLRESGLLTLADLLDEAYGVRAGESVGGGEQAVINEKFTDAIAAAKATAVDIPFEYEADRCYILYGEGLYGTPEDDWRLMLIFRDGTSQTVYAGKVLSIRVNTAGSVLYYTVDAPDGKKIQYGVNFDA